MEHQTLFSFKDNSKKIKVSSAAILLGASRVKGNYRISSDIRQIFCLPKQSQRSRSVL